MQRSGSFTSLAMALTLATSLLVLFSPGARAQAAPFASDAVLAQGNPPLTESMVTRFTDFQAWVFEIPLTPRKREKIRAMLLQDWKKPEDIKNDMGCLSMAALFAAATPDLREFIRVDLQPRALKELRADKNNPDAQWWAAAYDEAHPPIAAGNPPLTESMVSHYNTFSAWLLEIPLTPYLNDRLRATLLEDWKTPEGVQSDMKLLKWQLDMARYENGEQERLYERSMVQPDNVRKLREAKGDQRAQLLVAAYDAAHPPIAAGNPPLTRQASDAWTELYCLVHNQSGAPHMEATQAVKDDFAHTLAANWATYPPDQRKAFSEMPQKWALVRFFWAKGKDADRQKIMAVWQPVVNPSEVADRQLAAAQQAAARSNEFVKKDANTVSEQELLEAAKDADIAAMELRREGNEPALANAAKWEERARVMRAGKAEYLKQQANEQAKSAIVEEYLKTQIMQRALSRRIPGLSRDGTTVVMSSPLGPAH